MSDPRIDALTTALEKHDPSPGPPEEQAPSGAQRSNDPPAAAGRTRDQVGPIARASVALLVRPAPADLELLVIKRATHPGDPWSGHMAFPGGKRDPEDRSARETAERETREEIGVDLGKAGRFLGALQEVWPRSGAPAVMIAPFVFSVPAEIQLQLNEEVAAAFWIPLHRLAAPGAATEYLHGLASGEELRFPAIAYESHVIWGLTHRIMTEFLDVVRASGTDATGST